MRHVIIGNGPAGVVAAETIRKRRPRDEIVLIGGEPGPAYSRMAIPYLLIGNIDETGTHLRKDPGHWERLRVRCVTARVTSISTGPKHVSLDQGESIDFDTCLIATGSTPIKPPVPGIESPFVHPCWTLEDARNIMQLAKKGARVLQLGAGFIGCIILEALALRGVKLTVVEMGDRMVPRMMGPRAGAMIKRWCESHGVTVHTGTKVESIEPGDPLKVNFSIGKSETFDLVIQAAGVRPNIAMLSGTDIKCLLGVLVDQRMQTSVPGIYAAGDCAEAYDSITGKTIVSAIQPNAVEQARVAAINMAGGNAVSGNVTQINVIDTLGLVSSSFGQWDGVKGGGHAELVDEENYRYLRLEFDGDRLIGANTVGLTEHVGVIRGLVEHATPLGEWKDLLVDDPTRVMEAFLASTQGQMAWQGSSRGSVK